MMERFASIVQDDISNGDGLGEVLFVQYCSHHCKGCHNPQTWDKCGGYIFTEKYMCILMDYFKNNPIASRLTLSGGDPIDNIDLSTRVAKRFKELYPDKMLWIYTGYTYSDIKDREDCQDILELCDVLVDGEFHEDERDITLYCKGSKNQKVLDIKKTREYGYEVLWEEYK